MIDLYRKGLEELEKGIAIEIPSDSNDPKLAKARDLREKMNKNMAMVQDRLRQLGIHLFLRVNVRPNPFILPLLP